MSITVHELTHAIANKNNSSVVKFDIDGIIFDNYEIKNIDHWRSGAEGLKIIDDSSTFILQKDGDVGTEPPPPVCPDYQQEIDNINNEINVIQGDVSALQGDVGLLQSDVSNLQNDTITNTNDISNLQNDILTNTNKMTDLATMSQVETAIRDMTGLLEHLTTTDKMSLVGAINSLDILISNLLSSVGQLQLEMLLTQHLPLKEER